MSKTKRVSQNNTKGFPVPTNVQFVELWEGAKNREDFAAKTKAAGLYMSYATVLARQKAINAAMKKAGKPQLKSMPRKTRAGGATVDTESVAAIMARIRGVQEEASATPTVEVAATPAE